MTNTKLPSPEEVNAFLIQYQRGNHQEIYKIALLMTQKYPNHELGWKILAATLQLLGKRAELLIAIQKLLTIVPNEPEPHYTLGNTLIELGRYKEAEVSLRQAININQYYVEAHYSLGNALKKNNRLEEAAASFKQVISLDINHAEAHNNLGDVLNELKKYEEAEVVLGKSISLKPNLAAAHINLGVALNQLGQLHKAEGSLRKAISLNPDIAEAYNNLGITLNQLGKFEEAKNVIQQALVLNSNYSQAYSNLGITLIELGKLEEAKLSFEKSISLKPDFTEAQYSLATIYIIFNRPREAIKFLLKVIENDLYNLSYKATIVLAIVYFLDYKFDMANLILNKNLKILESDSKLLINETNYRIFLGCLLSWHSKNESTVYDHTDSIIHIIGESHSLASHGLKVQYLNEEFNCKAHLIIGCKQWHLGNNNENKYKENFKYIINSMKYGSKVLLAIGEIDCRLEEGILKYLNNTDDLQCDIIDKTIDKYLKFVHTATSPKSINVIIQGIPCPNIDLKNKNNKEISVLINLIRDFNFVLRDKSKNMNYGFLDVHSMTDRGDGFSNSIWHIDQHHLSPDGMIEAWLRHLI